MITRDNPLINAQVRQMLWEVPINFPGSRLDFSGETKPAIEAWLHKTLEADGGWTKENRDGIIQLIFVELFGPEL